MASETTYKLTYFPVLAKGLAPALALEFAGLEWEGAFPDDWPSMKQVTPWGGLPVLEIPGLGTMGHEIAILNYISRVVPEMGGASDKEFLISQQLMHEAEDIYVKLRQLQDTIKVKDKVPKEQIHNFWTSTDATNHGSQVGLPVLLMQLETFCGSCGAGPGKFTSSGRTVGELKLFSCLHFLKLIKDDVLAPYLALSSFYKGVADEEKTAGILEKGGQFPGAMVQYFVATPCE